MIKIGKSVVEFTKFPNGEILPKITPENVFSILGVTMIYEDDSDIFRLAIIKDYMDKYGVNTVLTIPYFPYSRMDRAEGDSVFTLKTVAKFINALKFIKVITYDAHSDVTPALLDNCVNNTIIPDVCADAIVESMNIVFPDTGAEKRYGKLFNGQGFNIISASKDRDFETGKIKSIKLNGELNDSYSVLIVDDLCSYGGTFIGVAKEINKIRPAANIELAVAHCENSIMAGDIFKTDLISKVYTTNSIIQPSGYLSGRLIIKELF